MSIYNPRPTNIIRSIIYNPPLYDCYIYTRVCVDMCYWKIIMQVMLYILK